MRLVANSRVEVVYFVPSTPHLIPHTYHHRAPPPYPPFLVLLLAGSICIGRCVSCVRRACLFVLACAFVAALCTVPKRPCSNLESNPYAKYMQISS